MEDEHCNLAFVVFLELYELHYYYILLLYCKSLQKNAAPEQFMSSTFLTFVFSFENVPSMMI